MDRTSEFWAQIDRRFAPGADRDAIDREIWGRYGVELAVMFTDLAGFSRGVASFGILHFLQVIRVHRRLLEPIVERHGGRILKQDADSLLIVYPKAADAVLAGFAMMDACEAFNVGRPPEDWLLLCLGIGFGRVLAIGTDDVYGAAVNAASKLGEDTAGAREILVTDEARKAAGAMPGVEFEPVDAIVAGSDVNLRAVRIQQAL